MKVRKKEEIIELKNKVGDFYEWACELPTYENREGRATQAHAILSVLDWVLGDNKNIQAYTIDAGDSFTNCIDTWDEFYRMLEKENNEQENEEEDE